MGLGQQFARVDKGSGDCCLREMHTQALSLSARISVVFMSRQVAFRPFTPTLSLKFLKESDLLSSLI